MTTDRRTFLKGGLMAGVCGAVQSGVRADGDDSDVTAEMARRLKFLSPPDGIAADSKKGVPFDSPPLKNRFIDKLFVPAVAEPVIDMSDPKYDRVSDDDWWTEFKSQFQARADEYRKKNIDIGELPVREAHQKFQEFRPKKFYVIREREFRAKFHTEYSDKTWAWGFEALGGSPSSPGPTIVARYGEPIIVRRINNLPEVGVSQENANLKFALPSTTTHLHNGHTASESDGNPNDWINPGEYWDHHYGNFPSGHDAREKLTTLWYHDHRMDYTAANVYAGLDGFYFLFDEKTDHLGNPKPPEELEDVGNETEGWRLPSGEYDVPLIFHDLLFAKDPDGVPQLAFDGYATDGILGDRYTVNRVVQPYLKVKRRKYRFRLLNGGPSRFYELFLHSEGSSDTTPFVVITGDGNFQTNPLLADSVYLGVAQRVDVIIDFTHFEKGEMVYLVNQLQQINGRGPTGRLIPRPGPTELQEFFGSSD
jgi:FtsP/CotA-like multicopper oxidase with cupredoxin domain